MALIYSLKARVKLVTKSSVRTLRSGDIIKDEITSENLSGACNQRLVLSWPPTDLHSNSGGIWLKGKWLIILPSISAGISLKVVLCQSPYS